jgi:hypothetical protein
VAKEVSRVLSGGRASCREGMTNYNKVWEFPYQAGPSRL